MSNFSKSLPYLLVILASATATLPLVSELIKKVFWKKTYQCITIFLLLTAGVIAIYDQNLKEKELDKSIKEKNGIIKTSELTLERVNDAFDSIKKVQQNIDNSLKIQKRITEQAGQINAEIDRNLSPIYPMNITVYYEIPMHQGFNTEAMDRLTIKMSDDLKIIKDSVDKIYGKSNTYNPNKPRGLDPNPMRFSITRSSKTLGQKEANEAVAFYDNNLSFIMTHTLKGKFDKVESLVAINSFNDYSPPLNELIQVDLNNKVYLITVEYLIDSFYGGDHKNPKHFGFNDLLKCMLYFRNNNLNYKLLLITLQTKVGLIKNCTVYFHETNVNQQYAIKDRNKYFKSYLYKIKSTDFISPYMWPF